ncbi:MAG: NAD(P)/FAD-dependent oxidoreductase [Kofleriaceae bacterium]
MARSSLFSRLQKIARQFRTARTGPSRREFLRTAVGAAAIVPLASACGDNILPPNNSIAIIGGGIAGLTCAHFLGRAGVRAEVYEASTRIGGRQFTNRGMYADDQIFEMGGELVDTDHAVLPMLADAYGITLDDLVEATDGLAQDQFFFDGAFLTDAQLTAAFEPVAVVIAASLEAMDTDADETSRVDQTSIPDYLTGDCAIAPTALIYRLLYVAYLEEFGLAPEQQSAYNLITLIDSETTDPFHVFGDSDERFHIHEGSDSIALAIAAELGDQVHLDHALTKVIASKDNDLFTLEFTKKDGTIVPTTVAHVVYALPFTKLREVDLKSSHLSDGKLNIINTLGYGTNAKLMMQFHTRPWETNQQSAGSVITDVGDLQTTWATSRGQSGAEGILTNFVGAQRGLDIATGTPESQATTVLGWVEQIYPGTTAQYIAGSATLMHWPSYEFTKGSYACYTLGQWSFLGMEGAREGNHHFCGEHCSEDFQGYMEGGAETGAMVAAEVLDDLGVSHSSDLTAVIDVLTDARKRPRASYHAGFGKRLRPNQVRRHR